MKPFFCGVRCAVGFPVCVLGLAALALSGCGGTGQDDGVVGSSATVRGVAFDGYLAGALCFLDTNGNYKRDAFEPAALTDNQGYYSYNPNTDTDYCASDATADQADYCLSALANASSAALRCRGGYDIVTEEPFEGTLTTRVALTLGETAQGVVVSPLTTLVATTADDTEKAHILSVLGVTDESELQVDYIATSNSTLVRTALRLQKAAQVLAEPIRAAHDASGDAIVDPVGQVYEALSDFLVANTDRDIATVLSDASALSEVAQQAETLFVAAEQHASTDSPVGNSAVGSNNRTQSGRRAAQVVQVATALCGDIDADQTFSALEFKRCARATEVVLKKVIRELDEVTLPSDDTSIDTAVTCLTGSGCDSLLQVLGEDRFDLTAIQDDSFTSPETTATAARVLDTVTPFSDLSGKSLRVNDPDNSDPMRRKHARLELYFGEGSTASGGPLSACVRYLDGAAAADPNRSTDDDISDGDTRGALVSGTWELLGNSGYSVVLSLRITDTSKPYTAIVKSAGTNGEGQHIYRFDFDDELENWVSLNGLETAPSPVPQNSSACRERFNNLSDG